MELLRAGRPAKNASAAAGGAPDQRRSANFARASQLASLGADSGVLGLGWRAANGEVATAGSMEPAMMERAEYLARLAAMVGEELGLDTLRELRIGGAERQVAWVGQTDGSSELVMATQATAMDNVLRKLHDLR